MEAFDSFKIMFTLTAQCVKDLRVSVNFFFYNIFLKEIRMENIDIIIS